MSVTVSDFDYFRANYSKMSYGEHRDWYDRFAPAFAEQRHFNFQWVSVFFDRYDPKVIVELGGWDGALAQAMLPRWHEWDNYEVADVWQICTSPNYRVILDGWAWEHELRGDAFIASHSLEHMSEEHLRLLLAALRCRVAFVDVPLAQGTTWMGDTSTHVLPLSLSEFDAVWSEAGWRKAYEGTSLASVGSQVRFYEREVEK